MAATVTKKCECCGVSMAVRKADVSRGWGRFCSKSCKAKKQDQRTASAYDEYAATVHPFSSEAFER